jgi:hypothetical protein
MPTYERLDYGSDDGSQWGGASTDKLSFYGSTPQVQQSVGENVSTATHASTLLSTLIVVLKANGLVKT